MVGTADWLRKKLRLEPQTAPLSGDSRYLTQLYIFGKEWSREELHESDSSQFMSIDLEPGDANIDPNHQKIHDKIIAALKLLTFLEQHVLVQFWSAHVVGKHQLLTTIDEPFGLGVINEGLCSYRQDSDCNTFLLDKDREEEDCSPAARVFRRGLPEWTCDLNNYTLEQFPLQEHATRCNLHGYLALPVFDLTTGLCVGVLELLTKSTTYTSYAYEVKQIQNALKTQNLTSQQAFNFPALYVPNEHRQKDHNKIYSILKTACDIHGLPLAQTWAVSQHTSFVSHEKVIQKTCGSFETRCVGKVCMSAASLPFHVKDKNLWSFREACSVRHLDRSRGLVGKALTTCGSCLYVDVTKLSEEEYPLVHNALKDRLTSCFAIFLHSVEANDNYVLEFFLPPDIKDSRLVPNLVQTLKQTTPIGSGFELGDTSLMPTDPSVSMGSSDVTQTSSDSVADIFPSSDSESLMLTGRKRKIGSSAVTGMVTAEITFNDNMKIFRFPVLSGLLNLEKEVAKRFKLKGKRHCLKYRDEENDLILITSDVDLKLATGSKTSIDLICLPRT